LASDFPRVWQDPNTPDRERKRMARLLLARQEARYFATT